jgi:hypothetical protein
MKRIHVQSLAAVLAAVLAALLMLSGLSNAFAQNADQAARIKTLIGKTYDRPEHKVETAPVVIVGDYALADWIQGKKGGRALLRRTKGEWEIMACGGDGFKDIKLLKDAGIPADTAKKLVAQLTQAEQWVSSERLKQFGLFGTPNDPRLTARSSNSKP